ncbi:MAG: hypothetical protein JJU36_11125 [Phycisphaeraceae bacterium]|nr:hypothetical protein [Phycisphaeraceae bacterium]
MKLSPSLLMHVFFRLAGGRAIRWSVIVLAMALAVGFADGGLAASGDFDPLPRDQGFVMPGGKRSGDAASEQESLDRWLSRERWTAQSFGISFRLPHDAELYSFVSDGVVLRIDLPTRRAVIIVSMVHTEEMTNAAELSRVIIERMNVQPNASISKQQLLRVERTPVSLVQFRVPRKGEDTAIMSRAFAQIDPLNYLSLQLDYDDDRVRSEELDQIFDAMLQSIRIAPPENLDRERTTLITAGDTFRQTITVDQIRRVMEPVRYFRIVTNGRDTGYKRIRFEKEASELGMGGVRLIVERRSIAGGQQVLDAYESYFLSNDRRHEVWDCRSAYRPWTDRPAFVLGEDAQKDGRDDSLDLRRAQARAAVPGEHVLSLDFGTRSRDIISVSHVSGGAFINPRNRRLGVIPKDDPRQQRRWTTPPKAYLSLLEREVLGAMLPRGSRMMLGFYSYQPEVGRIVLRTDRVEQREDGGFEVWSRVTLNHEERVSIYDHRGRLLERDLGNGVRLVASDRPELRRIWREMIEYSGTDSGRRSPGRPQGSSRQRPGGGN